MKWRQSSSAKGDASREEFILTKEHPRIDEFLDGLAGRRGLDLRKHCDLDAAHFGRCNGDARRPLVKRILSRMGFNSSQIKQSAKYFDACELTCDCAVYVGILNAEGGYETQAGEYQRLVDTARAGASSM
jgi:hypothetical protein